MVSSSGMQTQVYKTQTFCIGLHPMGPLPPTFSSYEYCQGLLVNAQGISTVSGAKINGSHNKMLVFFRFDRTREVVDEVA